MRNIPSQFSQATKVTAKKRLFIPVFYACLVLFATPIFGASLKDVTRSGGDSAYDSAVNQNFDRVNHELGNTVHKTGTETIRGAKTFSDTIVFQSSGSFNGTLDMNSHKITELSNGTASNDAAAFGQIPVAATQAEMEAASSNTVFTTPGRSQNHPGVAKAWVVFTSTGTLAILSSYNISSVTDGGVGNFQLNFTTAFSDTNYSCHGGGTRPSFNQGLSCNPPPGGALTTSAMQITCHDDGGASLDGPRNFIMCFGDQ